MAAFPSSCACPKMLVDFADIRRDLAVVDLGRLVLYIQS
jgi:hypothetical protein